MSVQRIPMMSDEKFKMSWQQVVRLSCTNNYRERFPPERNYIFFFDDVLCYFQNDNSKFTLFTCLANQEVTGYFDQLLRIEFRRNAISDFHGKGTAFERRRLKYEKIFEMHSIKRFSEVFLKLNMILISKDYLLMNGRAQFMLESLNKFHKSQLHTLEEYLQVFAWEHSH